MFLRGEPGFNYDLKAMAGNQSLRDKLQQSRIFEEIFGVDDPVVLGVCGCDAGAGASAISLVLAMMLQDRVEGSVLLLEANLRTPSLVDSFDLSHSVSFEDFASGKPSGPASTGKLPGTEVSVITANVAKKPLAAIKQARQRISSLRSNYSHVIVDLPPLLSSPDVGVLGSALDGVVLVLEAEETRWQVAKESKKVLDSANVNLLGTVLNKKQHYIPAWLYRLL